jgi:hypothetical protein
MVKRQCTKRWLLVSSVSCKEDKARNYPILSSGAYPPSKTYFARQAKHDSSPLAFPKPSK